jgi:hypothetical protein
VVSHVIQDGIQGANAQILVDWYRDMMLTVQGGGKAQMAACLTRDLVAESLKPAG